MKFRFRETKNGCTVDVINGKDEWEVIVYGNPNRTKASQIEWCSKIADALNMVDNNV